MLPRAKLYKAPKFRRKTRENTRRNEQERSVGRRNESAKKNGSSEKPKMKKKSFSQNWEVLHFRRFWDQRTKRTTMTMWLDVSVIGGIWGISNQPILSNSNNLRNIWKAVDEEGTETRGGRRWRGVSVEEGSLGLYLCNGGTLERKRRKGSSEVGTFLFSHRP